MDKSGSELFVIILMGFFLMLLMVSFIVIMVINHRQRQIQNKQRLENLQATYEKTILKVEKEIQEETLAHVGRELHDNIGQLLSLTKINLSGSKPEKVHESRHLISQTIKEVRALSKTLNLDWVEGISLDLFIQNELSKLEKSGFCKTEYQKAGEEVNLNKEEKLVLIRVIQECLNNAIKHAHPDLIAISLTTGQKNTLIWIRDDGRGFNTSLRSDGSGLFNLEKRMETIGGSISIKSEEGIGTDIKILLPNKIV